MSLINLHLISNLNKEIRDKLDKLKRRIKFPKELHLVSGEPKDARKAKEKLRDEFVANTILRKYKTMISGLYEDDSTIKDDVREVGRRFIPNKIITHQSPQEFIRRRLRTLDHGRMFTFLYNPKHRKTLPYYDVMPVIIPIEFTRKGFKGINFHHVEPALRVNLLKKLKNFKSRKDLRTFFRINFDMIARSDRFRFARPMIRSYLYSQIKGSIINIPEQDFDLMILLPQPQFKKIPENLAWKLNKRAALKS